MKKILASILFFFLICAPAWGANHYINAACSSACDGSTWAKGWATFGAAATAGYVRGDTYYIAGGTYNENVVIATEESGTLWLKLKKANAADNGSDAGWNASFASDQAVINGTFVVYYGYFELEGVTGSGTSGHGIKINLATDPAVSGILQFANGTASPRHVHHVEVRGAGIANTENGVDGVYWNSLQANTKGLHISYCWIHETTRNGVAFGNLAGASYADYGMLFENNVVSESGSNIPAIHGQGMQISYGSVDSYTIIRNNIFRNVSGTGNIVYMDGTELVGANHSQSRVYNNLFYYTDQVTYPTASPGVIVILGPPEVGFAETTADSIFIYNNTFWNIGSLTVTDASARIWGLLNQGTNLEVKNNLFVNSYFSTDHYHVDARSNNNYYNCVGDGVPVGETNQQTESADPFTNTAAENFTLKATASGAINNGLDFSSIFTTDFAGTTRGAAFDIGAYEYEAGAATGNISGATISGAVVK